MNMRHITRNQVLLRLAGLAVLGVCAVLFFTGVYSGRVAAQTETAPKYKVDASWPKPLPNKWKMGGVTGLAVDKDDNVWVYDRPERSHQHRSGSGVESSHCRLLHSSSRHDPHRRA